MDELHRYDAAAEHLATALALDEARLGPDHVDVGVDAGYLGELLQTVGRFDEAEPLYQRSLAIKERAFAAERGDHPEVLNLVVRTSPLNNYE